MSTSSLYRDAGARRNPCRIAVYGGTFDPPHLAHVQIARALVASLDLDLLLVIPAGEPPHKAAGMRTADERLELARLAFADVPRTVVDPREVCRTGASYTVDTLADVACDYPGAELVLAIGADQAALLDTWHDPARIRALARIVVVPRPSQAGLERLHGLDVLPLLVPAISSTGIRRRLAEGCDVSDLLPACVHACIRERGLYAAHPAPAAHPERA